MTNHTGTETRSRLLRESSSEGILHNGHKPDAAMPRVNEEGLPGCKSTFSGEEREVKLIPLHRDVTAEETTANSRASSRGNTEVQALIGITGRKAHAGGSLSQM